MRRLTLGLLALGLIGACFPPGFVPDAPPNLDLRDFPFSAGPYLIRVSPDRMAVVIEHDLPTPPVVQWQVEGTQTGTSSAPVRVEATWDNRLWVADLRGLPPASAISYTVQSRVGEVGPLSFQTGRARGEPFSFAAFGDTRTGHKIHRGLITAMAKESIDFVIHSGDLVETGGFESEWRTFFQIEAPLIAQVPIFASVGNHDNSRRQSFRRYFQSRRVANGHRYFAQDWGDVRVIIADSEIEMRKGSAQYAFLEEAMRDGAERDQLMFVSLHYPPYSSGAHGSSLETREVMGELCPRFGVEVVLAGHDHNYERTKRIDGVTYIVAASGGAPIRRLTPRWFSARVRTEPHYVIFDVERKSLVGRAVNLTGDTFDAFVVPPNPPRAGKK